MKPYYVDPSGITIYHGDCREVLKDLPSSSVDAVVTDPPYNVGFADWDKIADFEAFTEGWFRECERIVGEGCLAITCGITNVAMMCRIREPRWMLCWHKPAGMKHSPVGYSNWQPILLYGKSNKRYGNTDIFRAPIVVLDIDHPSPKPIAWAEEQIVRLTKEGQTVLEPFLGLGTTLIAAKNLNRKAIGIEIEERYCEIAAKRLQQEVLPLTGVIGCS